MAKNLNLDIDAQGIIDSVRPDIPSQKTIEQMREDIRKELREEVKEEIRQELEPTIREQVYRELESKLRLEIREEFEADLKMKTETEAKGRPDESRPQTTLHRVSSKQRRLSLDEYSTEFLLVPKIDHPKPVFISESLRDELDKVARRLGGKRMSASGIVENMVKHHFGIYGEDMEQWFKL